jgi:hypothetical protein
MVLKFSSILLIQELGTTETNQLANGQSGVKDWFDPVG